MSLLDIGLDAPAPSTNQQQQQQQQPLDPFGMPQNAPPQRQGPPITFDEPFESSPKPPDEPPPHQAPGAGISDSGADSAQSGLPQGLDFAVFDDPKAAGLATQPQAASSDIPASSPPAPAAGSEVGGQTSAAESVENAANEAAEAGGAGEAATKARLAEIERLFAGRWRLARSDPFGEYLKAVGVGLLTRNRAAGGSPDVQISVLQEHIYVNTSSALFSQVNKLRLDEATENVVHKTNQSVVCTFQNGKLELQMTPLDVAWSKTQGVEYSLNDRGELMVVYAAGSNVCRRCFVKVPQVS